MRKVFSYLISELGVSWSDSHQDVVPYFEFALAWLATLTLMFQPPYFSTMELAALTPPMGGVTGESGRLLTGGVTTSSEERP